MSLKTYRTPTELLVVAGSSPDGRKLDIFTTADDLGYRLLTIFADDADESLWVRIECGDNYFEMPIEVVRAALDAAPGVVVSEAWFNRNHPESAPDPEPPPAQDGSEASGSDKP